MEQQVLDRVNAPGSLKAKIRKLEALSQQPGVQAHKNDPATALVFAFLGAAQREAGRLEKAGPNLRRALHLFRQIPLEQLTENQGLGLKMTAQTLAGLTENPVTQMELHRTALKALSRVRDDAPTRIDRAQVHQALAEIYRDSMNYNGAENHFRRTLKHLWKAQWLEDFEKVPPQSYYHAQERALVGLESVYGIINPNKERGIEKRLAALRKEMTRQGVPSLFQGEEDTGTLAHV